VGLKLIGEVALDGSGFERGLSGLNKASERFASDMKGMVAGIFAATAFKELIWGSMEAADKIERLSQVYGLSTKTLQEWAYAAHINDTNLDALTKGYKKFAAAKLEALRDPGSEAAKNLDLVGIEVGRLNKEDPAALMYEIAAGMVSASENSDQFAAALKILGKNADDILPALKALSEGVGKQAPILDESQVRTLAAEGNWFKRYGAEIKGDAGWLAAFLAQTHIGLGHLVDDAWALAKIPFSRLFNKDMTWSEQREAENEAYRSRRAMREGLRYPGASMRFDRSERIQGPVETGGRSALSIDELVESAQKLSRAEEIREQARVAALSKEERMAELLAEEAKLMEEAKRLPYGTDYAENQLKLAKGQLEMSQIQKGFDKPNKEKALRTGDELIRVGNFLGSSRDPLADIGQRQIQILQRIAENTSGFKTGGGQFTGPSISDADFPTT
jgi:hypothetical protein